MENEEQNELSKEQVFSVLEFAKNMYNPSYMQTQYGVYNPQVLNQNLIDLNNSPLVPTYDKINRALTHPIESVEELQGYSQWCEFNDAIYAKTSNYFKRLLSFDLRISVEGAEYMNKKELASQELKDDYKRVYKWLRSFDYKREFGKMMDEMIKKNTVFTWLRDNDDEQYPQRALQMLPQKYCLITGNSSVCPMFNFNMAYFLNPTTSLDLYPPIFKEFYNNTFGNSEINDYRPSNTFRKSTGTFAYWTQTSPSQGAYVFSFTDGNYNSIPPFSYLLRTSILNPEIEALQRNKDIISAYALLYGEMETTKGAQEGQKPNQFALTSEVMGQFLQLIASGLNKSIKPLAFPLKEVEFKQFSDSNKEMAMNQYQTSASQGASASSMIYSTTKSSMEENRNQILTDYNLIRPLYRQFNAFLNYYINRKTRKYRFKFVLDGSNYDFERDNRIDRINMLADRGMVLNESAFAQAYGYEPQEFSSMLNEGVNPKKLQLLLNSNTTSGSDGTQGRPRKRTNDLADGGETSRDYE